MVDSKPSSTDELQMLRDLVIELCDQITHVGFGPGVAFTQERFNEIKVIRDDIIKWRDNPKRAIKSKLVRKVLEELKRCQIVGYTDEQVVATTEAYATEFIVIGLETKQVSFDRIALGIVDHIVLVLAGRFYEATCTKRKE